MKYNCNKRFDLGPKPQRKDYEGLMKVNNFFRNEAYTTVNRENAWIRNICFDEGNDDNENLMTRIKTHIEPSIDGVASLIFDSLIRTKPSTTP